MSKGKVVCISGGFDPLGAHHISYIQEAVNLGAYTIAILNNDYFLYKKKGYFTLPVYHRKAVLENIKGIDYVHISNPDDPEDMSVSDALRIIKPDIFAKGGDRSPLDIPIPEEIVCKELGIEIVYGVGGFDKLASSSWLMEAAFERYWKAKELMNGR